MNLAMAAQGLGGSRRPAWWSTVCARPRHSRGAVDSAGEALVAGPQRAPSWDLWEEVMDEYEFALGVINNWRSCHSYPCKL
jgi:hypothetical protein